MRATIRVLGRDLLEPPWEATLPAERVNPTGSRPRATRLIHVTRDRAAYSTHTCERRQLLFFFTALRTRGIVAEAEPISSLFSLSWIERLFISLRACPLL